jgi:hypothetical protein
MTSSVAAKFGGACAMVGATGIFVGNFFHPFPPAQREAMLEFIAAQSGWPLMHLPTMFFAVAMLLGLVAVADSLAGGLARTLAHGGRIVAQVGVPVMLVGVAIDGFAFKALADAWAAAPAAERQIIVVAADAVVLAETAVLHAWVTFFLGVPFLLFGAAFVAGGQYPRWLGWLGAAGGAGCLASGASGFLRASFVLPFPVFGTLVLAFTVLAGFYLLRAGDNGVVAAAARPYRVDSVRAQ